MWPALMHTSAQCEQNGAYSRADVPPPISPQVDHEYILFGWIMYLVVHWSMEKILRNQYCCREWETDKVWDWTTAKLQEWRLRDDENNHHRPVL